MNMVDAVKSVLTQYVGFSGRARRSEYWYWTLATILVGIVVGLIELMLGMGSDTSGPLSTLLNLALLLPGLAVTFRRLHDTGRSGWWIGGFYLALIVFVIVLLAMVGGLMATGSEDTAAAAVMGVVAILFGVAVLIWGIAMLVFLCKDSDVGPNKYGQNPKNEGNYDVFE